MHCHTSFVAHNGFPLCAVVAMPIDPHNTLLNLPHTSTHHEIHTCYPDAVNMSFVVLNKAIRKMAQDVFPNEYCCEML